MWRLTGFELPFVKKGWKDILRKSWVNKWAWQWNEGVADENLLYIVFDLTINAAIFYKKCGICSQTHGFLLLKINLGFFFCLQRQNTQRLWNTPSNDIDPKYHFSSGYRAASPSLIVCNFTLQKRCCSFMTYLLVYYFLIRDSSLIFSKNEARLWLFAYFKDKI